jgi:hypothetical protein
MVYSKGYTLIYYSLKLALVKWASGIIDVMEILFVSMHSYIWSTHLHTTNLEMDAMLVGLHYMINIIHTTPHCYLMHTFLATESYILLLPVKTGNLLLLFTIYVYCFESTAIKSPLAF